jgi:hypothetical protein
MEYFSTSKLKDEIKTEKFELNKFHASKKELLHDRADVTVGYIIGI